VGKLMKRGCPGLSDAEAAAYDAPFPDARHKAGVRAFPNLVPDGDDAPGAAISREAGLLARALAGESFMAVGMPTRCWARPTMRPAAALIRGCPPPMEVAEGGHFVQEWGGSQPALARFGLS
jgi:haloalkane dehalogenase